MVRARSRADLESLVALAEAQCQPIGVITATMHNDYPFRVTMATHVWQVLLVALADEITYDNFKDAVGAVNPRRARTYHDVWADLRQIETEGSAGVHEMPTPKAKKAKR